MAERQLIETEPANDLVAGQAVATLRCDKCTEVA